jgi:hypothetical protein
MLRSERWAVQREEASAFEHAMDDGVREVLVVDHASQAVSGLLVVKIMARWRRCRSLTT